MSELTFREQKTLSTLRALEAENPSIERLARKAFPGKRPWTVADRIVRNSLRRLIKQGLVERVSKGAYRTVGNP